MTVHFYEPPPAQKAGGLDVAIKSLRGFLENSAVVVETNTSLEQLDLKKNHQAIHFHGLWQPQFLRISRRCRQSSIPYVVSPHGMLEPWAWRHKFWKKLPYYCCCERPQLRNASVVLATSEQEAVNLSRFLPTGRIRVLPLGLPDAFQPAYSAARQTLGWDSDESVLLFLSRVHPKKGLHLLVRALCAIADSMPAKWRLIVVGDGDEKYVSECRECARSNSVVWRSTEWKGAVWGKEKWLYYQGADLFCLPSFSENFGLAVLEACQVGTQVLTTRDTPWSFLADERAAFLVEPKVESVQQGLLEFLKTAAWSQAEREGLSQRIHDRFGWDRVGSGYLELYEQITCSKKLKY